MTQLVDVPMNAVTPNLTQKKTLEREAIEALFDLPFNDLLFQAHSVHRQHFDANGVQLSTLLSIKTVSLSKLVLMHMAATFSSQRKYPLIRVGFFILLPIFI